MYKSKSVFYFQVLLCGKMFVDAAVSLCSVLEGPAGPASSGVGCTRGFMQTPEFPSWLLRVPAV
jgi:hypothetical protein